MTKKKGEKQVELNDNEFFELQYLGELSNNERLKIGLVKAQVKYRHLQIKMSELLTENQGLIINNLQGSIANIGAVIKDLEKQHNTVKSKVKERLGINSEDNFTYDETNKCVTIVESNKKKKE